MIYSLNYNCSIRLVLCKYLMWMWHKIISLMKNFSFAWETCSFTLTQNLVCIVYIISCVIYLLFSLVESRESDTRQQIMGLCGLLVFHYQLFNYQEKKLARQVWDLYKKVSHSFSLSLSLSLSLSHSHTHLLILVL